MRKTKNLSAKTKKHYYFAFRFFYLLVALKQNRKCQMLITKNSQKLRLPLTPA